MRLLLPFKKQRLFCGYKVPAYEVNWGYPHYGVDIAARWYDYDATIYASGDGTVVYSGKDNTLGYAIAVLYKDCENNITGERHDLIARYMHCEKSYVTTGQAVNKNTPLAKEGNYGTKDYHLHFELDTDTKYPLYSPQVSSNHTVWKKGVDSTVNPSEYLWSDEDRINIKPNYNSTYYSEKDYVFPPAGKEESNNGELMEKIEQLESENRILKSKIKLVQDTFAELLESL